MSLKISLMDFDIVIMKEEERIMRKKCGDPFEDFNTSYDKPGRFQNIFLVFLVLIPLCHQEVVHMIK